MSVHLNPSPISPEIRSWQTKNWIAVAAIVVGLACLIGACVVWGVYGDAMTTLAGKVAFGLMMGFAASVVAAAAIFFTNKRPSTNKPPTPATPEPMTGNSNKPDPTPAPVTFRNDETLDFEPISNYPADQIFVTNDNYAVLYTEFEAMYKSQYRFFNPYTNVDLSGAELKKLKQNDQIKKFLSEMTQDQEALKEKISSKTIERLKNLAEGLLNAYEITHGQGKQVPVSQNAYEKFNVYYQSLDNKEREALNGIHQIEAWNDVYVGGGYTMLGMKGTSFEALYESMDHSCVHSVAGSIVKLVFQLDSNVQFQMSHSNAQREVDEIRRQHNGQGRDMFRQMFNF